MISVLALAANLTSVLLLLPYKDGDANVRAVWLCSRTDAIGNVIVPMAALGVWGTATAWPDLTVAAVMAGIFLTSSVQILRQAWIEYCTELRHAQPEVFIVAKVCCLCPDRQRVIGMWGTHLMFELPVLQGSVTQRTRNRTVVGVDGGELRIAVNDFRRLRLDTARRSQKDRFKEICYQLEGNIARRSSRGRDVTAR